MSYDMMSVLRLSLSAQWADKSTALDVTMVIRMSLIAVMFSRKSKTQKQADDARAISSTLTRLSFIIKKAAGRRESCCFL